MPIILDSGDEYHYTSFFVFSAASAASAIRDEAERTAVFKQLLNYLTISVGRVYEKTIAKLHADNKPPLVYFTGVHLNHITDWLHASIINDEPWLKKLDDQGRPKKLMKFGSFEQILKEANKAMLKAAQKGKAIKLDEEDEQLFMELADGYRLVRLLTPEALDRESAHMQHCIGGGAYDQAVLNKEFNYFLSLRDPQNKPHVTIQLQLDDSKLMLSLGLKNYYLLQVSGKQNARPVRKYVEILMPFFTRGDINMKARDFDLGFVFDDDREPWFIADVNSWPLPVLQRYQNDLGILLDEDNSPWLIKNFNSWPSDVQSYFMRHFGS